MIATFMRKVRLFYITLRLGGRVAENSSYSFMIIDRTKEKDVKWALTLSLEVKTITDHLQKCQNIGSTKQIIKFRFKKVLKNTLSLAFSV